jgi:hypothetical protein
MRSDVGDLAEFTQPPQRYSVPAPTGIAEPEEQAILAPVTPGMSYEAIHHMSQGPLRVPDTGQITTIRRTVTIRPGTRMIKPLSARQVGAYLHGRRPSGFCYREFDLTSLRTPAELSLLLGDAATPERASVVFGLRWRAVDPTDYHIPFSVEVGGLPSYGGLTAISPHDRLGPPVLGTGFAPSRSHLVPEFVTTDFTDLPMPVGTSLVLFTPDGTEVSLYLYIPEQRGWTRMFGPQHKHLLRGLPEISTEQEFVQSTTEHAGGTYLRGRFRDETYEAVADPPEGFRVLSRAMAARYRVEAVARRAHYVTWHGAPCTVVRVESDWHRLRLCRPDRDSAAALGMQCVERGVYETWAPSSEVGPVRDVDQPYAVGPASGL